MSSKQVAPMLSHGRNPNHHAAQGGTMAEEKTKPETDAMGVTRILEVKGKIVDNIEITVTSDHHSIAINFSDNTGMILVVEPCIAVFPYFGDWKTGDCKVIKEWEPLKTVINRP
jgi:hypothetical protein